MYASRDVPKELHLSVLIVYIFLNTVLAFTLERDNRRISSILHVTIFMFVGTLLLLCSDNGVLAPAVVELLGQRLYDSVLKVGNCSTMLVPFAVVELVILLQGIILAAVMTRKLVEYLVAGSRKHQVTDVRSDDDNLGRTPPHWQHRKLYSLYEVIRC